MQPQLSCPTCHEPYHPGWHRAGYGKGSQNCPGCGGVRRLENGRVVQITGPTLGESILDMLIVGLLGVIGYVVLTVLRG